VTAQLSETAQNWPEVNTETDAFLSELRSLLPTLSAADQALVRDQTLPLVRRLAGRRGEP
jgi:hypothetical protein